MKLVLIYKIILIFISGALIFTRVGYNGIKRLPISNYKFLVGLNQTFKGSYNEEDMNIAFRGLELKIYGSDSLKEYMPQLELRKKLINKEIHNRIKEPIKVLKLFKYKFRNFWGEFDSRYYWSINGKISRILLSFMLISEKVVYMLGICFVLSNLKRYKIFNKKARIIYIIFLGYMFIY